MKEVNAVKGILIINKIIELSFKVGKNTQHNNNKIDRDVTCV